MPNPLDPDLLLVIGAAALFTVLVVITVRVLRRVIIHRHPEIDQR